jgi:hypothetical protein
MGVNPNYVPKITSLKDGNYDVYKAANIKISGGEFLPSGIHRVEMAVLMSIC